MNKSNDELNKHHTKLAFYAIKESRGITLVVLIITIVVLLILAGITIANLTGGDGILEQASNKKEDASKQQLQEQISLIAMNADTKKGELDINSIKNNIQEKIEGATVSNNTFPLIVDVGDDRFFVSEDGTASEWGYVNKEYIKSTGTQYIDTGVNPANTIDFEMTFKTDVNKISTGYSNSGKTNCFFGASNYEINKVYAFNFSATQRRYISFYMEK